MLTKTRAMIVAVGAAAIVSFIAAARAEDRSEADYQKLFGEWSASIAEIQKADAMKSVTRETEQLRALLSQAQAFLASEKTDEIGPIEERVAVLIRYAKHKVQRMDAESRAADAEEA